MRPPGNENATGKGGALGTNDAKTIRHPSKKVNGQPAPPAGYGWENGKIVPFAPDEKDEEITSEKLEFYRRFLGLLEWALNSEVSPKLAAVWVVLGRDRRTPREIAEDVGCSLRLIQLRISEADKILKELQREARP